MKAEQSPTTPRRPPFPASFSSSFAGSQYFDAIDGTVHFDGYELLSDIHRFIHFDHTTKVLVITTHDLISSPESFWMDMATRYPTTRFTFLVDMLKPIQQLHNIRLHTGSLKDLHDTFDLIHFQRPLAMSELEEIIALSKPGACVQTVQFQIKVQNGELIPSRPFTPHIHHRLHLIRGSTRWYKLAEARRRDPEGYQQLMRLMKQMFEKLDQEDASRLGRDMAGQHVVEFGQCVMLLEQLS